MKLPNQAASVDAPITPLFALDCQWRRATAQQLSPHVMFSAKSKPIEQTTAKDIWFSAFFGTLIGGGILVGSFFSKQPQWFLWIIRCFSSVWLVGWWRSIFSWRRHLAEYQRQKCNH